MAKEQDTLKDIQPVLSRLNKRLSKVENDISNIRKILIKNSHQTSEIAHFLDNVFIHEEIIVENNKNDEDSIYMDNMITKFINTMKRIDKIEQELEKYREYILPGVEYGES